MEAKNLLEVRDLCKYFKTPNGMLHAVDMVSFQVKEGTTLGVVGESGCGKSTLGRAVLGLNEATAGQVLFDGTDITHARGSAKKLVKQNMQIIFQDPYSSLDDRKTVKAIIEEPLKITRGYKARGDLERKVAEMMETVGLASRYLLSYPHELDGGRRQRIGIARALMVNPRFIVCDEPVSALDVSIQAQILNLMMDLQEQRNLTYVFITHNLSVIKHISDEIMVMYMGCVVEKCKTKELFQNPLHPYTVGLLEAIPIPSIDARKQRKLMEGEVSSPINPKPGCRFCDRCEFATEECSSINPKLTEAETGHFVACHHVERVAR